MASSTLEFSQSALGAVQSLRIQLELNENVRLRCRTPAELVKLVETAKSSTAPGVADALEKVAANLTPQQISELQQSGVNLASETESRVSAKSYRGVKLQADVKKDAKPEGEQNPRAGKRKIIYRGQVQWV